MTTNQKVLDSSSSGCTICQPIHSQWVTDAKPAKVDSISSAMNGSGDKMETTREPDLLSAQKSMGQQKARQGKPAALVNFGSAAVPVYRMTSDKRVRFTISYHGDGKRLRQVFPSLDAAKKEAQLVAQRIQSGMQHVTDMRPHDRDAYVTATEMLAKLGIPLVAAVEDYVRSRSIAGTESLASMATDYSQHFGKITRRATVPEVVKHLLESKEQDGASGRHLSQLKSVLTRFAAAHPGSILVPIQQGSLGAGACSENRLAPQCAGAFVHQLSDRQDQERRPSRAGSRQLAVDHLQALPGTDHGKSGGRMVWHPAESRPVEKHLHLRHQDTDGDTAEIHG